MNFAKLSNGALQYAPNNYTTSTGSLILNFNKSISAMRSHGFKELIDIRPSYNPETHYISIDKYIENDESIMINYIVNEIIPSDEGPSLEERVADLEEIIKEQYEMIKLLSESSNK